MTKKHYIKIADIIKSELEINQKSDFTSQEVNLFIDRIVKKLSDYFKQDNANFDANRFADYIYN